MEGMMKILIIVLLFSSFTFAQDNYWQTLYEQSIHKQTPRYQETIGYCQKLAVSSPWVKYRSFGKSPQGRDLPLLIVNKRGNFKPQDVHRSANIVFLIQACIHPGESDGKDAGLMLIRDMVITKELEHLLDNVTVLFIPIFNVDGHERFSAYNRINQNGPEEMGWRTTAQNLNLNRDFLKADAPEMQYWLKLYNEWLPDFFADCHVTDGADYQYPITYKIDQHGIMDQSLIDWVELNYLPPLLNAMEKDGYPTIEYVSFKRNHDIESGMTTWAAPPGFSDGYAAIQNRPGLLIETHMFKDYKTRVSATYAMLKHTIEILNDNPVHLKQQINIVDQITLSAAFREDSLAIDYRQVNDSTMIDFLGYQYLKLKSDLSGGDWYRYTDIPKTFRIPFYNKMRPSVKVRLPEAYVIPAEWDEVIQRIQLHGIKIHRIKSEKKLMLHTYKFTNAVWSAQPYEGRHPLRVETEPIVFERIYPPGSVLIDMNQRTAKVIANILEPRARDSFVYWGFFDAVFEQKEYVESYVMEERARIMLASDEDLKKDFDNKRKTDKTFAQNPGAILMWFYQKTPYWDQMRDIYPVGKIFDRELVEELKNE
ncbi:MAG: M14 family metallopeptidase [Calditrichaceae bacterium]|nr:M14 family metallopeptidase [Calditrichaceae bacterium]RQV96812.1 MAG: hypothetical protein EH224_03350 [Calditrichota bacterium]